MIRRLLIVAFFLGLAAPAFAQRLSQLPIGPIAQISSQDFVPFDQLLSQGACPVLTTTPYCTERVALGLIPLNIFSGSLGLSQLAPNAVLHGVVIDVAGVLTWKVIPDCQDTGGNHLNYTQSTDQISCGSSGGGGGGGSGTVSGSSVGQVAVYTASTTVAGGPNFTISTGDATLGQAGTQGSIKLGGSSSGTLQIKPAAAAGSGSVITLPAGTTDFSATGGANQFVQQASVGAPLTVVRPSCSSLSDSTTGCNTALSSTTPNITTSGMAITSTTPFDSTTCVSPAGNACTIVTGDNAELVRLSNAGALAVTLPQAGSAGFGSGWSFCFENDGAGAATITTTTSKINGKASNFTINQSGNGCLASDGTNWYGVIAAGY